MTSAIASNLLEYLQLNSFIKKKPLPAVGTNIDEFAVISNLNQPYGPYGYATALTALSPQGHLIVIFKGTDDLSDIIADIQSTVLGMWPEVDPTGTCKFVYGLLSIFRTIFVPWLATINKHITSAKQVTLVGHSAGATFRY